MYVYPNKMGIVSPHEKGLCIYRAIGSGQASQGMA